jgi:hypothetical protein
MKVMTSGGRFAAASLSVCLTLLASAAPSYAINQVATGDVNGGVMCGNCSPNHQVNTTTGTASDGSASNNSGGNGSNFDITYGVPNDGQMYSGELMTQVVNADGSVSIQTWPISDYANGNQGAYATGWNNASIPVGGSASISLNETAPNGATFTAGFKVNNFGK